MTSKVEFKCSTTSPKTHEEVTVTVTAPSDAAAATVNVIGNVQAPGNVIEPLTFQDVTGDGKLRKATFVPNYVGRYHLTVNYAGRPCANSPLMMLVAPRGDLKVTMEGGPKFNNPHDIVEFGDGFLITNKGNHEVVVTDRSGFLKNKFITPVLSPSQSFEPYAIAVQEDDIVVTDLENRRVLMYNKDWIPLKQIGEEHLYRPTGVAMDEDRKVYVADDQLHSIRVFDKGHLIKTIGWEGSKPGELNHPWFLAINTKQQLVVADCQNCRVQIFNAITGELIHGFKVQLDGSDMNVRGLALDKNDNIYITVITKTRRPFKKVECAMVYTMEGDYIGRFGSGFFYPRAIRIVERDGETLAYIVDGAHHRILAYVM